MKQTVAKYIANFLVANGITDIFTVTGGGAMYLNDAFGHHPQLTCLYNHHEQASAMAAEAYARIYNRIAIVCVTSGPGATNAITGVAGGYMDSIPMFIISGQARYSTTVYASGLKLRTRGIQEFDIINSVRNMTKYCELVSEPEKIKYCLEKAIHTAYEGRPGPVWLDIPLDVQGATIETDELTGYVLPVDTYREPPNDIVTQIIEQINRSKRPVIFIGNGVRLAGAHEDFLKLSGLLQIPVVTGMNSIDGISSNSPLYIGRGGNTGDRAGNFAIQNSDLLLSFGSKLSFLQTGFNYKSWARCSYKIINDIDPYELEKDSLAADIKVCCDAKSLINLLIRRSEEIHVLCDQWLEKCQAWKKKYPVVQPKHYIDSQANIYAFFNELTKLLNRDDALVTSVGTSRVAGSQASIIHEGMRFITNPTMAAMGYCLPAAIGVCVARGKKKTVLVTGDGSFQMNIQELQTIIHNKLPIVIFIMNNQGYHSIRTTQNAYFSKPLVGVGPESGDLSFPDLSRLVPAYGYKYYKITYNHELHEMIEKILNNELPCICEVVLSTTQVMEPKESSKRLSNGQMVSAPLEDMAPFLSRKELKENMYIPLIGEEGKEQ